MAETETERETNRREIKKQRHRYIGRKTEMKDIQRQRQTEGEKQETGAQRQKGSQSDNSPMGTKMSRMGQCQLQDGIDIPTPNLSSAA